MHLLILAIAPAVAIAVFIFVKDKYEKEPVSALLKAFLFGAFSTIPAILIETAGSYLIQPQGSGIQTFLFAFIIVGLTEELCKFIPLHMLLSGNPDYNEPFDGIVYAVMVSMGFATVENVFYVFEGGISTGLLRMFISVPAHATFGVIMGYFYGKSKFEPHQKPRYLLQALAYATILHGAFDYFLFTMSGPQILLGGLGSFIIAVILSLKAIRLHQQNSIFQHRLDDEDQ